MRCTFCLSPHNGTARNCAVCGAPLPLDTAPQPFPTSSTRSSARLPEKLPKSTVDEIELSHFATLQTTRNVLATTFLRQTRRGKNEIVALFDDGSAISWRVHNNNFSQIEECELLAPLRHAPALAACNNQIAWTARDEILTVRLLPDFATSRNQTSSTRCESLECAPLRFSSPICRLCASRENTHIAVATADGQVFLLSLENDEIAMLWSVDTLSGVTALALSDDNTKIAVGKDSGHLALHNRDNVRDCWTTDTNSLWVCGAAFSPNGHALALVDCNSKLQIRAAQNSASLQNIALSFAPEALCFLQNNRHLVAANAQQFAFVDSWTGHTISHSLKTTRDNLTDSATKSVSVSVCGASEKNLFAVAVAREIHWWRF